MNIIRELRKRANLQQKELAAEVGVSVATVSDWETQKKDPSGDRLHKLAQIFGVDELVILGAVSPSVVLSADIKNQITMTDEEKILVSNYRALTSEGQAALMATLSGLLSAFRRDE